MRQLALVLALLVPAESFAGELKHRVGRGDSLDKVAKHFYGAAWKSVYLAARNSTSNNALRAGQQLVVPASWSYKVRAGDSLGELAKKYLGGQHRYTAMMRFNGIRKAADLAVGTTLLMPFHLTHIVQKGESYSAISRHYYRSTKLATVLREYNSGAALNPADKVTVPIFDRNSLEARGKGTLPRAAVRKPKPPAPAAKPSAASSRPTRTAPAGGDTSARVRVALARYRQGEFEEACAELDRLLNTSLRPDMRLSVIQHLGYCGVALDDEDAAEDYFRKWLELEPGAKLDKSTTSPKIRQIFQSVADEMRENSD